MKCDIPVNDVEKVDTGIGIRKTIHRFFDANGKYLFLPCISYHIPTTYVKLLSPQNYNQIHGAHSIFKEFNIQTVMKNHSILIPINIQEANLNIFYNYYVTSSQKKRHWPLLRSCMAFISLDSLYFFGNIIIDTYCRGTEG